MRHTGIRALVPALALIFALAASAWADCAPYVSSGPNDEPDNGMLIGTETRTETIFTQIEVTTSGSVGASSTSAGASTRTIRYRSVTRTYQVGTYRMTSGRTIQVDCSTYTLV